MANKTNHFFHNAFCFAQYNFQKTFSNPKPYCILLMMSIHIFWLSGWVRQYLHTKVQLMNIVEFFILLSNDREYYFYLMIALIFLISDCPYAPPGIGYYLLRSNRQSWFWGQVLYIAIIVLLVNLFLMIMCIISIFPYIYISNEWSVVIQRAGIMTGDREFDRAFNVYPAAQLCEFAKHFSPLSAWGMTLGFNILWMTTLCLLSLTLALLTTSKLGFLVVGGIITFFRITDLMLLPIFVNNLNAFNFVYLSRWIDRWYATQFYDKMFTVTVSRFYEYTVPYSLCFFSIGSVLSCLAGRRWAKRYDFSL